MIHQARKTQWALFFLFLLPAFLLGVGIIFQSIHIFESTSTMVVDDVPHPPPQTQNVPSKSSPLSSIQTSPRQSFFGGNSMLHVLQYGDPKYQKNPLHQRKINRTKTWATLAGYTYTMLDYSTQMPHVCGYTRKVAAINDTLANITLNQDWLLFLDLDATPLPANVFAMEDYLMQHERINASHCHLIVKSAPIEINTGVLLIKSTLAMRTIVQGWLDYQIAHPFCKGGADQPALATVILQREHAYRQTINPQYNISAFPDPYCSKGAPGNRVHCWKKLMNKFRPLTRSEGRNPSGGDPICELGCKDSYQCHYCTTKQDIKRGRFRCNESAAIFFHSQKKNDKGVYFPPFVVP